MKKGIKVILLVEDEERVLDVIELALVSNGFKVFSARDGKKGCDLVEDEELSHIDLILTDVIMPNMNGKEMTDQLKPMLPKAKVIFMSGYSDDKLGPLGVLGPDIELIEKPFLAKNLVKRIREF